jgi:hypothetical protein
MSRCISCDKQLVWQGIVSRKPDGSEEDMCPECLSYTVYDGNEPIKQKEYIHAEICRKGYIPPKYTE